jgi:hypothetical protein
MIKAEMIGSNPTVEVEVNRFHNGKVNFVEIKLGDLVIELDQSKVEEIFEKIDFAMWDETKEQLEAKVEELETENERLRDISIPGVGYIGKSA